MKARVAWPARAIARLGLMLGATGVGLLIGEAGLRLADLPQSGPFLQEFRGDRFKVMAYDSNPTGAFDLDLSDASLRETLSARLSNPAELGAHWQDTPHAVAFEFNEQGFRERRFAPKSAGARRIVVLGDSFTLGHGLPNALAYPRLLEVRLQRAYEHELDVDPLKTSIEVLNLGIGDTDLPGILRTAKFALRQLEPDVLVYGYFLNDPVPTLARAVDSPIHDMLDAGWGTLEQSRTMTRIGQAERGGSRVVELLRRFLADRRVTAATIDWYRRLHERDAWRPTLESIVAMANAAKARGARFVLLLLPLPYRIGDSPFAEAHRQMSESASRAGLEVVDALPALARKPDDDLRLHPRDRHPSPLYTRVVAELLAAVVSKDAGVPAAGRARSPR